jgi:hypothetical protein
MAILTFYDDRHVYELDGVRIPSVSEILRFGAREVYGTVDQYTLDNAAERGKRAHQACEDLDLHGECEIDTDITPYAEAYKQFLYDHKVVWDEIELALYHPTMWYAGRIDRAGTINGRYYLVDIKTSCTVNKKLVIPQLTAYAHLWMHRVSNCIPGAYDHYGHMNGSPEFAAIHLKKNGSYKLVPVQKDCGLWKSYLTIHHSFARKEEKNARTSACAS